MSINYVVGDATVPNSRPAIIAHVCNDVGGWGAGFVLAISRKWKQPEHEYREAFSHNQNPKLGHVQIIEVEPDLWVANMIAQHSFASRENPVAIRYDALTECLMKLFAAAKENGASVHMPRIGCGLAGGEWSTVGDLIDCTMGEIPVTVYTRPQEAHLFKQ